MRPDADFDPKLATKRLLRQARSGAIATLMAGSGDPYCSLVSVATDPDGAPLLLLSDLAVHSKNIRADPRVSLMVDERAKGDPLEGARAMLMSRAERTKDPAARRRYLAAHPEAEMFASFRDFAVYRLELKGAHLVAGFGRIVDLAARDILTDVSGARALLDAEPEIVAHMNEHHREALGLYATKLLGAGAGAWRCTGCDPDGLDLEQDGTTLRLGFPERVTEPGALRRVLKELATAARGS